jgi:integrase
MIGCRPLSRAEQASLELAITGRNASRDRCLVALGCNTGYRISELLSLNLGDVVQAGAIVGSIEVKRRSMKGKHQGRQLRLNEDATIHLAEWVEALNSRGGMLPTCPLFCTSTTKRMTRFHAYRVIRSAAARAGISGRVATHSMRKSFAARTYDHFLGRVSRGDKIDPFRCTSKALGHASIQSTDQYLSFHQTDVDDAVMAIGRNNGTNPQNKATDGETRP